MDTLRPVDHPRQPAPDAARRRRRLEAAAERRHRRVLAIDIALGVGVAAIILAALPGLGVVAWFALPVLVIGLVWLAVEALVSRARARRHRVRSD